MKIWHTILSYLSNTTQYPSVVNAAAKAAFLQKVSYLRSVKSRKSVEALQLMRPLKQCLCILNCRNLLAAQKVNCFHGSELSEGLGSSCISE